MSKSFIFPVFFFLSWLYAALAFSQCAPGIPSAGNPGCIPLNQPGSPYYQHDAVPAEPVTPPVAWADQWGAIAMDASSGKAGTVSGSSNKAKAESEAMERCGENGGLKCKLLITYHNQCVAATQNINGGVIFAVSAPETSKAENTALSDCGGADACRVIYSRCSYPKRIQ
jgi:hypothetical protein